MWAAWETEIDEERVDVEEEGVWARVIFVVESEGEGRQMARDIWRMLERSSA